MSVDITTLTSIRTNLSDEFQRLPPDVRERYPEVALAVQGLPNFDGDPDVHYQVLQTLRARLVQDAAKIIDPNADDPEAELAAMAVATGDIDHKIMRLHAVLSSRSLERDPQFRAAMPWLTVGPGERAEYLARYKLLTGNDLEADIDACFPDPGNPDLGKMSRGDFLKHVLAEGELSPLSATLLRVGAVDSHFSAVLLTKEPKAFLRDAIRSSPDDFRDLAYSGDQDEDERIRYLRTWLRHGHTGILGEQQAYLQQHFQIELAAIDNPRLPADPKARYLLSLVYDFEKDKPRTVDKLFFRQAMQDFARDPANAEAIAQLKAAYDELGEVRWQPDAAAPFEHHPNNPYKQFWALTRVPTPSDLTGMSQAEVRYNRAVLEGAHDPDLARIYDARALLDRRSRALVFKKKADTRDQLFRLLSCATNWDVWDSLARFEGSDAESNPDTPVIELAGKALTRIEEKMKAAGLSDQDVRDLGRMLEYGGAHDPEGAGDPRAMTAYLELSRLKDQQKTADRATLLGVLSKVEPDSYDYYLIRNDPQLLKYVRESARGNFGAGPGPWRNFADALNLGEPWKSLHGADPPAEALAARPKRFPEGTLDTASPDERARYWAARVAAEGYYSEKNGRRALEAVARAQAAGVRGDELAAALAARDPEVAAWLVDAAEGGPGEQDAHQTIDAFFRGKPIVAWDLVRAADKRYRYDKQSIDFAVDFLSPDQVLSQCFGESLDALAQFTDEAVDLELKLAEARLDGDDARAEALLAALRDQQRLIEETPLKLNPAIDASLGEMMRASEKAELVRRLQARAGQGLIDGDGPAAARLRLSPEARQAKGVVLQVAAGIGEQRQLQSSWIGWHRFHKAGVMTSARAADALGQLASVREVLAKQVDLSDTAAVEALVNERLNAVNAAMAAERKLTTAQADWRRVQDEYKERTVTLTGAAVSLLFTVAALGIGVGAAPAVTQIIWAASSSLFQTMVKQGASFALSRRGDTHAREVAADCFGSMLLGAGKLLALDEIELAARLGILITRGGGGTVFEQALASLPSKLMSARADAIKDSAVRAFRDGVSGSLADRLAAPFRDPQGSALNLSKAAARDAIKGFLGAVIMETSSDIIEAALQGNYHDTKDAARLYQEKEEGENVGKLAGFFYQNGLDEGTQFGGSNTEQMGAPEYIGETGPDDLHLHMLHALKTAVIEQCLRDPLVDRLVERVAEIIRPGDVPGDSPPVDTMDPAQVEVMRRDRDVAASLRRALSDMGLQVPPDKRTPTEIVAHAAAALPEPRRGDARRILDKLRVTLEGGYPAERAAGKKVADRRLAIAAERGRRTPESATRVAAGREATKRHIRTEPVLYHFSRHRDRTTRVSRLREAAIRKRYGFRAPRFHS